MRGNVSFKAAAYQHYLADHGAYDGAAYYDVRIDVHVVFLCNRDDILSCVTEYIFVELWRAEVSRCFGREARQDTFTRGFDNCWLLPSKMIVEREGSLV